MKQRDSPTHLSEWLKSKELTVPSTGENPEQQKNLINYSMNVKGKPSLIFLYNQVIMLLDIYPTNLKILLSIPSGGYS